jgi:hypothetical protein
MKVASGYQGIVGAWGYSQLLLRGADPGGRAEAIHLASTLGPWVLGGTLAFGAFAASRLTRDVDRLALLLAVAYTAAAGWGVHWLAWMVPAAVLAARPWSALFIVAATAYTGAIYIGFGGVLYGVVWLSGSLQPLTWAATLNLWAWTCLSASVGGVVLWTLGGRTLTLAALRALAMPAPAPARAPTAQSVDLPASAAVAPAPSPVPARR